MSGGFGLGGMGFGGGMSIGMPSMMPAATPSFNPMAGPMSFGMGMSMGGSSMMSGPMTNTFGPSTIPTTQVSTLQGPMSSSFISAAPATTPTGGPQGAIAPDGGPIYNEGQNIPGSNTYGQQDMPYTRPESRYPEYDPYLTQEGNVNTPVYSPEMLNEMKGPDVNMQTGELEFSAQSRPNPMGTASRQIAQNTFEGLGGAGPSADALQSTNTSAPSSSFSPSAKPADARLANSQMANNVRGMDSALQKAGFSPNQRNAILEQVYRENGFQNDLLFGTHKEPAKNAAYGRENIGALSWGDPGRNAAFKAHMRAEGVMDAAGNMKPGQATLDAQARFIKQEMGTYARTKANFLDNPNVDINQARVVLGDDYIGWRRTDPALAGHTTKMARFQAQLNNIRSGGNPFPTPTQGSMANVPTSSYGKVDVASMKVQPTPFQEAAMNVAKAPLTGSQAMQQAFSVSPVEVRVNTQAAIAPAPVAAPVQPTPQISVSTALEQAFTSPMPENGQQFDTSLADRAKSNLETLTNPVQGPPPAMSNDLVGGDRPTSDMVFAQPDPTTLAAEALSTPAEPSVTPESTPQNAPQRPLEARTGVSRSASLPRPTSKSSQTQNDAYSPNPEYYLDNASLLNIGPIDSTGRATSGRVAKGSSGGMEFSSQSRKSPFKGIKTTEELLPSEVESINKLEAGKDIKFGKTSDPKSDLKKLRDTLGKDINMVLQRRVPNIDSPDGYEYYYMYYKSVPEGKESSPTS